MNTITIPSPAELRAAYYEELQASGINDLFVSYECIDKIDRWSLVAWFPGAQRCRGYGATPDAALIELKAQIDKREGPLEKLRSDAARLGMTLVPA